MADLRCAVFPIPTLLLLAQSPSPDAEMAKLKDDHLASRVGDWIKFSPEQLKHILEEDRTYRIRARKLLAQDHLKDPHSYDHAALIFQHGDEPDDALVARELSMLACFLKATYMSMPAMAEDKYLLHVQGRQRFGCGHGADKDGRPSLNPMEAEHETSVTDALRQDCFVPALALSQRHSAQESSELGFPQAAERMKLRMKPDAHGPDWITDPARGVAELTGLKAEGLSKRGKAKLRARVLKLYRADHLFIPADYHRAAELLMAGAEGPSDLLLANELAAVAVMRLHGPAWRTFVESWDRFARAIGQPTRYGTLGDPIAPTVAPALQKALKEVPP